MLNTVEFGWVRIAEKFEVNSKYDTNLGWDLIGAWNFWQLANGEIVAIPDEEGEAITLPL